MMSKVLFLAILCFSSLLAAGQGRYPKDVVPLSRNYSYFQNPAKNHSFWKLMPAYRAQKTDSSCSVASVSLVLNALVPSEIQDPEKKMYHEESLLSSTGSKIWRNATKMGGTGMTLKALHQEIEVLLKNLKLDAKWKASFIEMKSVEDAEVFYQHLNRFEKGEGYLILMYGQGMIMEEKEQYPHFSPVGAFDKEKDQILMLDVDGDWYEPYWVGASKMLKSISIYDKEMKCQRGLIWIEHKL